MERLTEEINLRRTAWKILTFVLLAYMVWFRSHDTQAQSRKYFTQFSHLQGYYNPGLTAYEGSMVKGLVRNQWSGWEGAPKSYFVSAELDFSEVSGSGDFGKNAVGVNLLSDEYGAFRETELIVSYSTRVRVSEQANLRLGAGLNINQVRLDGNNLSTEQAGDPTVSQYLGGFANMSVLDFNLGLSLTHPNYYVSYGLHNVNQGNISSGDVFMEKKPVVSIAQAGYRNRLSEVLSVSMNVLYRNQEDLPGNVEFNLKALFYDKIWVGGGHRVDYANSVQVGMIMGKLRFGYVYELPSIQSYLLPNSTHELMLSISLFEGQSGMIW